MGDLHGDGLLSKLNDLLAAGSDGINRERAQFLVTVFRGLADQLEANLCKDNPSQDIQDEPTVLPPKTAAFSRLHLARGGK